MSEPVSLALFAFFAKSLWDALPEPVQDAAKGLPTEVAGSLVDRLGLERLGRFLDRRTNHDIQQALRRAWKQAVEEVFAAYEKGLDIRPAWIKAQKARYLSKETLDWLFPLNDYVNLETLLLSSDSIYLGSPESVNTRLMEALKQRGIRDDTLIGLDEKIQTGLLNGLTFHFVEEIKRDPKACTGLFFRQFLQLREGDIAIQAQLIDLAKKVDALNAGEAPPAEREALDAAWQALANRIEALEEWNSLLQDVKTGLEALDGYKTYKEQFDRMEGKIDILVERVAPAWNPREHVVNPPRRAHCFGRDAEIDALVGALCAENPLPVPITGEPGIGKTTLACRALNHPDVVQRYDWRRFWVDCRTASSRDDLAREAAASAGLPEGPDPEARLLHELRREPALLALDNLETTLDADPDGVAAFLESLAAAPGLALVVTRRGVGRPGNLAWQRAIDLDPVDLPAARDIFCVFAGEPLRRDSRLNPLLEAAGRVPMAIELLARNAEEEPDLDHLLARYEQNRARLFNRLYASIELSVGCRRMKAEPAALRLLSLLALLPAGIARDLLPDLLPDGGLEAVPTLRDVGLANWDGVSRLQTLSPIRDYVRGAYPPDPADLDRAIRRFLRLAQDCATLYGAQIIVDAVPRLAPEVANAEAMILRSLDGGFTAEAAHAACGLGAFSTSTGGGGARVLEQAAVAARSAGDRAWQANCIKRLGDIALARSDHETARKRYEAARPLYEQVGDVLGQANCIQSLGHIALRRSDHETARTQYETAQRLFEQVGDVLGQANCIQGLGHIALARSDHEEARTLYARAQRLFEQVGSVLGQANCIQSLGDIALARSDHETARKRYEEALRMYEQVGDVLGQANCIQSLGDIALARSDHETARKRYEAALRMYERIQEPYSIGVTHYCLARIAPDSEAQRRHVHAARRAWTSIGFDHFVEQYLAAFDCPEE